MTQFSPFSSVKIHPRPSAPSAENSGTIQGYSCASVSIRGFRLRGSGLGPMALATERVDLVFQHSLRGSSQAVAQQAHK